MSVLINNNGTLNPIAGNGIQNTFTGTEAEVTAAMAAGEIAEGTVVYITDDNGVGVNAERVTYDNTESGLTATNVQDAIDELETSKQDKLTDPLTKSDVVNNLTTTTTNVPLSAAQGKTLNDNKVAKTGDTMSGNLTIGGQNKTNLNLTMLDYNGTTKRHEVWLGYANNDGIFRIYDSTRTKNLLSVGLTGSVYLDGVTFDTSSHTISKNTYLSLYGDIYLFKSGKSVQVELHGFKGLQGNYENTPLAAGVIPQAYRPHYEFTTVVFDGSINYRIKILTTGAMTVYPYGANPTGQNNIISTLTYLTN